MTITTTSEEIEGLIKLIPSTSLSAMVKALLNFKSFSGTLELVEEINGVEFDINLTIAK